MPQNAIDDEDWLNDIPSAPSSERLTDLSALFRERQGVLDRIAELEAELKVRGEQLRHIDEVRFPKLFDEAGVTSFEVPSNSGEGGKVKIEVVEKLYGSIPKDPELARAAMDELKTQGATDIFKAEVSVTFSKGDARHAFRIAESLKKAGYVPSVTESVHAQTLQAWAREQLRKGKPIDLDKLGLYNRRYIKVK